MIYLLPGKSSYKNLPIHFGNLTSPHRTSPPLPIKEGRWFAVDNQCFTKPFNVLRMNDLLKNLLPYKKNCLFVVVPDIPWLDGRRVFDAQITLDMFYEYGSHVIFRGWPLAYVAQNGAECLPIPAEAAAVFVGGDILWKESEAALYVIKKAKSQGLWVHVGRVNSRRRIRHFQLAGVDSVDGTGITYEPSSVLKQLTRWLSQAPLPFGEG